MLSTQRPTSSNPSTSNSNGETNNTHHHDQENEYIRDIHALTPPHPPPPPPPRGRWETGSHRSHSVSMSSEGGSSENFTSISREFNALVLAGSAIEGISNGNGNNNSNSNNNISNFSNNINDVVANGNSLLSRIGEDGDDDYDQVPREETNPLAIVPDNNPLGPEPSSRMMGYSGDHHQVGGEISVQRVKKEEVETKISAWQNAKVAKINNRFKREEAIINGWENEQVQKSSSWMKKVERKLEEKRARALEKMQNKVAKAHRKAEERRASAEAKRGTKVARVFEVANLMRAVGRPPAKRSFF